MRSLLLFLLVFPILLPAQPLREYAFAHQTQHTAYTLRRGDYLKVLVAEDAGQVRKYRGGLDRIENGHIYLKSGRAIALDRIQDLQFRPKSVRWGLWAVLIIGYVLLGAGMIGFLAGIGAAGGAPPIWNAAPWLFGLGLALWIAYIPASKGSLRRMEHFNTEWKAVEWTPAAPVKGGQVP